MGRRLTEGEIERFLVHVFDLWASFASYDAASDELRLPAFEINDGDWVWSPAGPHLVGLSAHPRRIRPSDVPAFIGQFPSELLGAPFETAVLDEAIGQTVARLLRWCEPEDVNAAPRNGASTSDVNAQASEEDR